jgi:hypothetical protein
MNKLVRWAPAIALGCCSLVLSFDALAGGGPSAFSIDDVAVIEGSGDLQFTVTASPPPSVATTVSFVSSNVGAQAGPDYTAAAGTLAFGVGVATQTITIAVASDVIVEADETLNVTLSNPDSGATLVDALGVGTIGNDDQTVVSLSDSEADEGDAGSVPMDFALSLSNPVQGVVNLAFQTLDGNDADPASNATVADGDYVAASGVIGFPSLVIGPQPVSIAVTGDLEVEPDQAFGVSVGIDSLPPGIDPADVILPPGAALGRIRNDDGAVVSVGDVARDEGDGAAGTLDFPITLSNPSKTPISVAYSATAGSAQASDFTAVSGTFVIPAGTTATSLPVPVTGESLVEPDETVILTLSSPSGGFLGDNIGLGTLRNDDSAVLGVADSSLAEGNSGTSPMTFAVTLSNPVQGTVGVNAGSADGANADPLLNATLADNDYQQTTTTLSFPAGTTTQNAPVPIVGDTDVESNQQLRLSLSNLSVPAGLPAGSVTLAAGAATGTIQNDDGTALAIADANVIEGTGGNTSMNFAITLSAPSEAAVTVTYQAIGLTATANVDFVAANGTLTLPANTTTASLTVAVIGDNLVENSETLLLQLSNAQGATIGDAEATGTIADDDGALLRLADGRASEQTSGNLVLIATLSNPVAQVVTVQYASSDGSAIAGSDYTAVNGQLTFAAGTTSANIVVPLRNDGLVEASETFSVTLSNPVPGAPLVVLDGATANGTIVDDETIRSIPAGTPVGWLVLIAAAALLAARARRRALGGPGTE